MQLLTRSFFDTTNLMPHGYCLIWNSTLLWLHVISDALIVLSYYSIPVILIYFIRKYQNFPFNRLLIMLAAFILACGTTHLLSIITIWQPTYWLEGFLKLLTAILSMTTAIAMITIIPKVLTEIRRNQLLEKDMIRNSRIALATFESAQSMYITDTQGYFINVNQAFSETNGYSMTDLAGKKVSILRSEHHDIGFYNNVRATIMTKDYWSGELWNRKKNGENHLELVTIIAVKDEDSCITHYVVTGTDISTRKAYEVGLIEAKEKAERFSTLKTQFIASMSHEIRTPMSAIIGFSKLALYEDMPENVRTYLQDINTVSTSLLGILEDILNFTKLGAKRVTIEAIPFNVLDLLSNSEHCSTIYKSISY